MKHAVVTADFSGKAPGKIKPLHGVNNSPVSLNVPPPGKSLDAGLDEAGSKKRK